MSSHREQQQHSDSSTIVNTAINLHQQQSQNHRHEEQQFDANSHLSIDRSWKQVFASAVAEAAHQEAMAAQQQGQQQQRPMAVAVGIQRQNRQPELVVDEEELTFVRAMAIPHCAHTDWDALREFRLQELDEVAVRFKKNARN